MHISQWCPLRESNPYSLKTILIPLLYRLSYAATRAVT